MVLPAAVTAGGSLRQRSPGLYSKSHGTANGLGLTGWPGCRQSRGKAKPARSRWPDLEPRTAEGNQGLRRHHVRGFVNSILFLGLISKERLYYWKLFFYTLLKYPRKFPMAISLAIYGYHFRKIAEAI